MISKARHNLLPYITFFIWPLLSLFVAVANFHRPYAKNIFWLFSIFLGYTIIIPDVTANHDLVRYKQAFERYAVDQDSSFMEIMLRPFSHGLNSALDIYLTFMNTLVSRFTGDFKIFLAVIATVFGYFLSRNLFFIFDHYKIKHKTLLVGMIMVVLFYIFPFWVINGYRFTTASVVFIFGVFHYLKFRKARYILVIVSSILIHYSFVFAVAVFLLYLIAGNRLNIYFVGVLFTLALNGVSPQAVFQNNKMAPAVVQNKVKAYSSEDEVARVSQNTQQANWYVRGFLEALKLFVVILVVAFWFKRNKWLRDRFSLSLICFGLLLFAATNLVINIPSMPRFLAPSYYIFLSGILVVLLLNEKRFPFQKLTYILLLPFLVYFIVRTRIGFEEIGLNTLFLNPMLAPFFPDSPNLMEFIK